MLDFDAGSRNDVIGFTEIPLRGVLQGGRLAASLSIWQDPARKKYSKLIPAGAVKGGIELITEPKHAQFGDVVNRLPNTTYLAVNIIQCHDLKAGDADGSADPYVTVPWDQIWRQSLPLSRSRSPTSTPTLRCILTARCEAFRLMFNSSMREGSQSCPQVRVRARVRVRV